MTLSWQLLPLAYALDLVLGDPPAWPHPVRWMGTAISRGEALLRSCVADELLAGGLLTLAVAGGTYAAAALALGAAWRLSALAGTAVSAWLLYTTLSVRSLAVETRRVATALESGDLPAARRALSMIVGRDTAHLDEPEIVRAAVECVAESAVDGVISPLFYAALGGPALALGYKAINTLDSMIGHKDSRYIRFGRFAAKLDTAVNKPPALLSGLLLPLAAGLAGFPFARSLKTAWTDGAGSAPSNAAIPEAAMAGALGVRLGGSNRYGSRLVVTPFLGESRAPLRPEMIERSIRVMYFCAHVSVVLSVAAAWAFSRAGLTLWR